MSIETKSETNAAGFDQFREDYAADFFDALTTDGSAKDVDLFRSLLDLPYASGTRYLFHDCPAWVYSVFEVALPQRFLDDEAELDWTLFYDADFGKLRRDLVEYVFDKIDEFEEKTDGNVWELNASGLYPLTFAQVCQAVSFFECYADRFDLELVDGRGLSGNRLGHYVAGRVYHGSPQNVDRYAVEIDGPDAARWIGQSAPQGSEKDQIGAMAYLFAESIADQTWLGATSDHVAPSVDAWELFETWADGGDGSRDAYNAALAILNNEAGRVAGVRETEADENGFDFEIYLTDLAAVFESSGFEYWATVNESFHFDIARSMFAAYLAGGYYLTDWVAANRPEFEPDSAIAAGRAYREALTRVAFDTCQAGPTGNALVGNHRRVFVAADPAKRRGVIIESPAARGGVFAYVLQTKPMAWEWGTMSGPEFHGQSWGEYWAELGQAFGDPVAAILADGKRTRVGITSDAHSAMVKAAQQ